MAGTVKKLKAGIRFNEPDLKYISLLFAWDVETHTGPCTIDADVELFGTPMKIRGTVNEWAPVNEDAGNNSQLPAQATRATKTTTKKTTKESK